MTRFIAISKQTKSEWVKCGIESGRIDVVYNGVDIKHFIPSNGFTKPERRIPLREDIRLITYVGRIDRDKGLESLLKAIRFVQNLEPNVRLCIAGKPHVHPTPAEGTRYQTSLMDLARRIGVGNQVEFLGHVADPLKLYQDHARPAKLTSVRDSY